MAVAPTVVASSGSTGQEEVRELPEASPAAPICALQLLRGDRNGRR